MWKQHPQGTWFGIPPIVFLWAISLFCLIGGLGIWLLFGGGIRSGGPHAIDLIASNRGRMLAVRLPPDADGHQEQVLVYPEGEIRREDMYIQTRYSRMGCGAKGQLPSDEREAVNALRVAWCATPPDFPQPAEDEPFYDLGLACGANPTGFFVSRRRIQIPLDRLPPELQMLIDKLPSVWEHNTCP